MEACRTDSYAADVEVDWAQVDPAAAASLQMALDLGIDLEAVRSDAWRSSAAERREDTDREALMAQVANVAAQLAALDEADADSDAQDDDTDSGDDRDAPGGANDGDHDECGMEAARASSIEFSRGGTETQDWAIDGIRGRRRATKAERADWGGDDLGDQGWMYQVQWKFYAHTTWERRAWLLDEGHGTEVLALDRQKGPQAPTSTRAGRPKKPPTGGRKTQIGKATTVSWQRCAKALTARLERIGTLSVVARMQAASDVQNPLMPDGGVRGTTPEEAVMGVVIRVVTQMYATGRAVLKITAIRPESFAEFSTSGDAPITVYHGTTANAITPIRASGLLVPGQGTGVKVVNGSAYGIGIYTATDPSTPLGYTRGGNQLFVCAGNPAKEDKVASSFRVFFSSARVVPLLLIDFGPPSAGKWQSSGNGPLTLASLLAHLQPPTIV
jgi:hypothetical protein